MKILSVFIITVIISVSFGRVQSQSLMFDPIKAKLTEGQIDDIEDSEKALRKTESYLKKAKAIESKYSKLKNSRKKKKKKKYETKTWEAKKYRIAAAEKRQKAYEKACDVYSDFITSADFYYGDDESTANGLNDGAKEKLDGADDEMKSFKSGGKKKDFKKKVSYSKLSSSISSATSLQNDALKDQFTALNLYLAQEEKKRKEEEDNTAWRSASQENTTSGYQNYLNDFSKGKYVSEARTKIRELEEKARKEVEEKSRNMNSGGNYTFSVQIAATRTTLSKYVLGRKYSDVSKIQRTYSGNYYKYRVGSLNTYADAARLRDTIRRNVPGAFIVVFDKSDQQIEVTNEMKPVNMRD